MTSSNLSGKRVAIANRGEIAIRIAATCERLGAIPILLAGGPDLESYAARQIGRVELIGDAGAELDVSLVVGAAQRARADFLHPGYGFLSEHADLADACETAGIGFVGPSAATLRLCGDKLETRAAAVRANVPVLPASAPLGDEPDAWFAIAREIGFPLLVKPAGAGGGRGLRHVADEGALVEAISASRREGSSTGSAAVVYLEREMVAPRHVEVQIVADGWQTLALGDRDCSLQRRHQKVIEEAPAPNVDDETRRRLHAHAVDIANEVGLRGIGTCEFMLASDGEIAFLEVNPRIQVEHPVTELVTGIDLVAWQLLIASGGHAPEQVNTAPRGHAVEARIYAEDPWTGFLPSSGKLTAVSWPNRPNVRVDAGYATGDAVPTTYDPMLAKVVAYGIDRVAAIVELRTALRETVIAGVRTNISWAVDLLDNEVFLAGAATTQTAGDVIASPPDRSLVPFSVLAHALDVTSTQAVDPWSAIGPWRMSGAAPMTFHGEDWESRMRVARTPDGWRVETDDKTVPFNWWRDASGVWTINVDGAVAKVAVTALESGREVVVHGASWIVHDGPRPVARIAARERASDGQVRAPMPASVVSVHVEAGDRVEKGTSLVTLTAMKMEIVCDAPVSGVVDKVSCSVGDIVTADQVLVTIRVEGADPSVVS